jgi:hypothetical protein
MSPVLWMLGPCLVAWAAASLWAPRAVNPEMFWGMAGPLVSASATWVVTARTYAAAPERLTQVMVLGFGVRVLLFGTYVVGMLRGLGLRPMPFVVSFAGFFIALHVVEAMFLRRLFAEGVAERSVVERES